MPMAILATAEHVVACDGAAKKYRRRFGKAPEYIIGDMDSGGALRLMQGVTIVRVREQESNDLGKAIRFCRERGWQHLAIVGATGLREDHALGNIFRAMEAMVPVFSDYGVFIPFVGRKSLAVRRGAAISVFATDRATKMSSKGLKWPLNGVRFDTLYRATLNCATAQRVVIESDRPAFVYIAGEGL